MSYKKAWEQISSMNAISKVPVVNKNSGGKGGGGTEITEHGEQLIKQFKELKKSCNSFIKSESKKYKFN
jgi:molybdate transport system regulatory protein